MVEGAPHTAKRSQGSIVVSRGAPLPSYIKEQGGGAASHDEARQGGVLLLPGVGLPPFPCWTRRERGKRWRGGRKGGRHPPLLVLFGLGGSGVRPCPGLLSSLPPRPTKAH